MAFRVDGMARGAATLAERFPDHTDKRVVVDVEFDDAKARQQLGDGFDGLEKVYAHVPDGANGSRDIPLNYSHSAGGIDSHGAILPADIDKVAVRSRGISFYAETNLGRVWLQGYGDNVWPKGGAFDIF